MKKLLLLLVLPVSFLYSQEENRCVLHLSQPFYVGGEIIWYKVFTPDNLDVAGKVIDIELYNSAGEIVSQHHLKPAGKNYVFGYIPIATDWPKDRYWIAVSAKTTEGENILLVSHDIPIYNDNIDLDKLEEDIIPNPVSPDIPISDSELEIELSPGTPGRGEKISGSIELSSGTNLTNPNLSISIVDNKLLGTQILNHPMHSKGAMINGDYELSENILLKGKMTSPSGEAIFSRTLGGYIGEEKLLTYTQTRENGNFILELPDFFGNRTLQMIDYSNKEFKIEWEKSFVPPSSEKLSLTPAILEYIRLSQERKKIYQLFSNTETPIQNQYPPIEVKELKADRILNTGDYDPFPNLVSFFREIITPFKLTVNNRGKHRMRMFNPETGQRSFYKSTPIVLIEDYITRDAAFIADLDYSQIQRIELFYIFGNLVPQFGFLGYSGAVAIYSDQKLPSPPSDALQSRTEVFGFIIPASHPQLVENSANRMASNKPVFRPHTYWNPSFFLNSSGSGNISFTSTDDKSEFLITIINALGEATYHKFELH